MFLSDSDDSVDTPEKECKINNHGSNTKDSTYIKNHLLSGVTYFCDFETPSSYIWVTNPGSLKDMDDRPVNVIFWQKNTL